MTVSLVAVTTASITVSGSITPSSWSQSPTAGNLLVAVVTYSSLSAGTVSLTGPGGSWAELISGKVANTASGNANNFVDVWYLAAVGGDPLPTFTPAGGSGHKLTTLTIFELSGANNTTPLDTSGLYRSGSSATTVSFTATTGAAPAAINEFAISAINQTDSAVAQTWTDGSGFTPATGTNPTYQNGTNEVATQVNYLTNPSTGSALTASGHFSTNTSSFGSGVLVVIAAAGGGPTTYNVSANTDVAASALVQNSTNVTENANVTVPPSIQGWGWGPLPLISVSASVTTMKVKLILLAAIAAVTSTVNSRVGKLIAAQTVITGTATRALSRTITAVTTATGSVTRTVTRTFSAQVEVSVRILNKISRIVAGIVAATVQLPRTIGRTLAGLVTVTGVLGRSITRSLNATITVTAKVTRSVLRVLAAQLVLTGSLTLRTAKPLTGAVTATGTIARGFTRKLIAQVAVTGSAAKRVGKSLVANIVSFATTVAQKISLSGPHGPLHLVLPGSGVTSGAFNIVIPAVKGALTGAFSILKYPTLPKPIVSLTGKVWYAFISFTLPKIGVTLTGKNYHSVVTVALPEIQVSLTGTVIGNVEGSIFVDLSNRSMGTRFFEELLSPARWKLGAPKRQWNTKLLYTQETLGQLGTEWGEAAPPEIEEF